ncbi:MAG: magnesium-translocating P-type ATPase [Armatimonadota bacterium]|nr:magnesium-translocating P-type ATPase [Armatimonadota bacterium]MDW8155235.1 magnesium-translocating P-type ATPase [Armatimonadota bacterium]
MDTDEARRRLARHGPNEPVPPRRTTALRQLASLLSNPLTVTLLVASGISASLGEWTDAALIVTVVALSTAVNFAQFHRSQRAVERLQATTTPTATVLRDGRWQELPRSQLVPGDVVRLVAGDLVPADGRLVEARHLFVQQASLTGESLPVEKVADPQAPASPDPDSPHMVFLGSSVVSGVGVAEVVATGPGTVFGALARRLAGRPPETEFERGLREFSHLVARTVVLLTLFVLSVSVAVGRPPLQSLLFALALAVGLTPEFLPMVTTIALAQGAVHMARRKALVRSLPCIEDLGSLDVLCTDKTGTLTVGEMQLDRSVDLRGRPYPRPFALAWLNSRHQGGLQNPLDAALLQQPAPGWPEQEKLGEVPFDFDRRRASVAVRMGAEVLLVTKGAPESVLPCCTHYETCEGIFPLDADAAGSAAEAVRELSRAGFRTLAVAWRALGPEEASDVDVHTERDLVLAGFVAFADPPLPEAGELIRRLQAQGVRTKLVTGDHELVAVHVWRSLGLDPKQVVLGEELARLDAAALEQVAEEADIFARVSPAQKHQLVLALKRRGHVVGFLGDGINDAPSLHAADVGISVVNAADVAREAADVVLLDRRLETVHDAILEGRLAFGNVLKFLLMETSSNFGNVFSMAGAALFLPFLPMLPHQILLNNFLYDLAQLAIPADPVDPQLASRPRRWDVRFVQSFMWLLGPVSSVFDFLTFFVLLRVLHAPEALFHTGWFVESLATQCLVVFVIRTARAPWRHRPSPLLVANVLACVLVGLLLPYSPLAGPLGFVPLPVPYLAFVLLATGVYLVAAELAKRLAFRRAGLLNG